MEDKSNITDWRRKSPLPSIPPISSSRSPLRFSAFSRYDRYGPKRLHWHTRSNRVTVATEREPKREYKEEGKEMIQSRPNPTSVPARQAAKKSFADVAAGIPHKTDEPVSPPQITLSAVEDAWSIHPWSAAPSLEYQNRLEKHETATPDAFKDMCEGMEHEARRICKSLFDEE